MKRRRRVRRAHRPHLHVQDELVPYIRVNANTALIAAVSLRQYARLAHKAGIVAPNAEQLADELERAALEQAA